MTKFEDFKNLMEKNWPTANATLFLLFPRLGKISNYINDYIDKLMKSEGLLATDFHLITAIRRTNTEAPYELKPSELCNYLLFSWGGITKVMKRLEDKEIITRVNCVNDKRIRMIRLTKHGEKITEQATSELQRYHKILLKDFTTEEIALLDKLLEKLLGNAEAHEEANDLV